MVVELVSPLLLLLLLVKLKLGSTCNSDMAFVPVFMMFMMFMMFMYMMSMGESCDVRCRGVG